ncbi:MAG: class I SAM-dependent methyltransferase [Alphaproteobacteria bacterium]|nr:class I SAM-dependent methyltransferase [Alphaproteobacteria bacterium]
MSDWGAGYITDKAYVHDFCRVQAPPVLAFAALGAGVLAAGGSGEPIAYCDLGCGQGYTANLIAAANPEARVLGVDFNPSHVANARTLAASAGLSNIEFRESGFTQLAADPTVPEFDVMAMHGVFSWISRENRRALVELIGRRLKPGGLLYISYDCMPGWAAMAPLRRILARHFAPRPGLSSPAALEQAIAYADGLRGAEARFHRMFPNADAQMERLKKMPRAYLAHEILTRDWEAFCFGEVAAELADAKLVYVASAHLTDSVDRVNFSEAQVAFLASLGDPVLQEETRDMMLARQFRRDVFAKGVTAASAARVRAAWLDTRFALTAGGPEFDMTFETPVGKLQLRDDVHGALVDVLRQGPVTLREAIERLPQANANWTSITDILKLLVGRADLQPALPAAGDAKRAVSTKAFNRAVLARAMESVELGYLASPVTGGGVRVDRLSQLYLLAKLRGLADPTEMLAKLALEIVNPGGGEPDSAIDRARELAKQHVTRIERDVVPLLGKLGVV